MRPANDAGPAFDGGPSPDAGAGCGLGDGGVCALGATCPSPDGCNTCSCTSRGLACTERACFVDAGPADAPHDATCVPECAAPPPGCHYEGPVSCSPPSCGHLVCADAGPVVTCGASFPTFGRSCHAASDCYVAVHQTDCCGNSRAMGISATERAAFDRAEGVCRPMYPASGCPERPPVTDDGMTSTFDGMIPVECRADTCTTYVRAS